MPALADEEEQEARDQGRRAGRRPRRGRWGRVRVVDRRRCRHGLGCDRQRHAASPSTRPARSPVCYPGGPAATLAGTFNNTNSGPVYVAQVSVARPARLERAGGRREAGLHRCRLRPRPARRRPTRRSRPGPACRAGAAPDPAGQRRGQPGQLQGRHAFRSSTPATDRATRSGPVRRAARVTGPERTSHGTPTNRGDVRRTARAAGGAARSAARRRAARRGVAALRRAPVPAARRHPGGARPAPAPPRRQGEGHRCGPRSAQPGHVGPDRAQLPEPEQAPGPDEPRPGQDHRNHRAARGRIAPVHHGGLRGPADAAADPLRVPARSTTDLAAMRVPIESWPSLRMLNRPLNQDGCKGAEIRLQVQGTGADGGERDVDELQAQAVTARPPAHRS